MNIDEVGKKIKNDLDKYSKLKKFFSKIQEAESQNNKKRIEYFEQLFEIREHDNEGLNKINNIFREEMKKIEVEREKHLKILSDLIIPVTEIYPMKLKNEKQKLDNFSNKRKNFEKIKASTDMRLKSEDTFGKDYIKFEKNKISDNKYLIMHFIYSELRYHSASLEKMGNLFYKITNIEPFVYLKQFGENYEIKNFNFEKLRIDIEEIEKKEKDKKEKEDEEKDEVYEDEEEKENNDTTVRVSTKKSKIKNSSIKKSKNKSKNTKISGELSDEEEPKTKLSEDI